LDEFYTANRAAITLGLGVCDAINKRFTAAIMDLRVRKSSSLHGNLNSHSYTKSFSFNSSEKEVIPAEEN
jgi:hypothetical protein